MESNGSDMSKFKATEAGGPVEGVIIGPESSVGTVATSPSVDQGNEKGLQVPGGQPVSSEM
jgi:hypothetical protein